LRFSGNDIFFRSLFMLPETQIGWQYLRSREIVLEAAAIGGLVLTGRDDKMPGTRNLDVTFAAGAVASFSLGPLVLLSRYVHIVSRDIGGGINWIDALLCSTIKGKYSVCARGTYDLADVVTHGGMLVGWGSVTQVGFLLGMKQDLRGSGLY
jgi:hypothetical protein